ncbi:unnamed protein product, partial [Ixodes persulcatus]
VCWAFRQRSEKPVRPFESAHSKSVKIGIIKTLITSAKTKSCQHSATDSIKSHTRRLLSSGYPVERLVSVFNQLINPNVTTKTSFSRGIASIPYIHNASHRIRSIASRYDTKVVFSSRFKLASMCNMIYRKEAKPA